MAWVGEGTTAEDATRVLGPGATRVYAIEYGWLAATQPAQLVDRLWPWWNAVITSTVAFSGIRLRNGTEYPYGP